MGTKHTHSPSAADEWAKQHFAQQQLASMSRAQSWDFDRRISTVNYDSILNATTQMITAIDESMTTFQAITVTAREMDRTLQSIMLAGSVQPSDADARFRELRDQWRLERPRHSSSVAKMAMCPSYQLIIGLGDQAVRPILNELKLQTDPEHWFWALAAITGAKPVPPESRGHTRKMAEAWIQWGVKHGYLS
jgi:hypothetical protein